MKKIKFISIILLMLFYILIFFSCKNDILEFKYLHINKNIICYNKSISKNEIDEYIKYYLDKTDQIYLSNNLTDKKISEQKLIIILCKDSFSEWDNAKTFKKNLENKLKIKDKKLDIFSKSLAIYDDKSKSIFINSNYYPSIILKIGFDKRDKFIITISEYNHYLISNNTNNKINVLKDSTSYKILTYILDEGLTNYLYYYLKNFSNNNFGNFIYEKQIVFDETHAKNIYIYLLKYYKERKMLDISFQNLYENDEISYNYNINYNLNYNLLLFSYINYFYGQTKLIKLIRFLYNSGYNNIDEIFYNIFNKSALEFFKEIDKKLKISN